MVGTWGKTGQMVNAAGTRGANHDFQVLVQVLTGRHTAANHDAKVAHDRGYANAPGTLIVIRPTLNEQKECDPAGKQSTSTAGVDLEEEQSGEETRCYRVMGGIPHCQKPMMRNAGAVHTEDKPPADDHPGLGKCNQLAEYDLK